MTEAAADSQNVYARGDQLRSVVMSQAVQRDMWHFDLFHAHRPFLGERVGIADLSIPVTEHESVVGNLPQPELEPYFLLRLSVGAQPPWWNCVVAPICGRTCRRSNSL